MKKQKHAIKEFIRRWKDRGHERKDSHVFWIDLLHNIFGVENPAEYISFEDTVMMDRSSFLDGYIDKTKVLIEQKGRHRDLQKGIKQSDGTFLTPIQQAKRYSANLPYSKRPRWIITSNFKEFYIYDMERPNQEPAIVKLEDLESDYYRLEILIDKTNTQIKKETMVSIQAGELIGEIYEELLKQYKNPSDPESLASINQLCVRLVFCFYAEDAGLFGKKGTFHDYLKDFPTEHFRYGIMNLFDVLNTNVEERDPYLDSKLASFPFVNGGLFGTTDIEIPTFTDKIRDLILDNAASEFNWAEISPTIFGSVFESTLNPEERHGGGMHYTSIENIHRVIDPLFLTDLKNELNEIKQKVQPATIQRRAKKFQNKLANLHFFDPACGSGNFLTETYIALRELENEAIRLIVGSVLKLDTQEGWIKVNLDQFSGIEINDFAVSVAKTALWIAESQMFEKTKDIVFAEEDYLPIKSYSSIFEGNALQMEWEKIINKNKLNYIIGNPPFLGYRLQNEKQKSDLAKLFNPIKSIDYVSGWFYKVSEFIQNTKIRVALVSTNSIIQGEHVEKVWGTITKKFAIKIDFAYRSFNWDSEAKNKAKVHVVIIGFSDTNLEVKPKIIFDTPERYKIVNNINFYLSDADNIIVKGKNTPIHDVQRMLYGSEPREGGNLILSETEKEELILETPEMEPYIKRFVSAKDYISDNYRYCLWLVDASPSLLRKSTIVKNRLIAAQEYRRNSKQKQAKASAETPYLFTSVRQPETDYLLIPIVSSENRKYIPIGYVSKDIIVSNACNTIAEASLYTFGIMTSNVHMAWVKTVAGRLKSDFRYSSKLVYNTFPWPNPSEIQKITIEKTAQQILDARSLYPESSLSDLYSEIIMPKELIKAHQANDSAVMEAYGMKVGKTTESDSIAHLITLYKKSIS